MYPINIFQIGPITIYSFGAMMALAALTAAWVVHIEFKRTYSKYEPPTPTPSVLQ